MKRMNKTTIDSQVLHEIENLVYEHAWLVDGHQSDRLGELYVEEDVSTALDRISRGERRYRRMVQSAPT
jgi:hypothetical protein